MVIGRLPRRSPTAPPRVTSCGPRYRTSRSERRQVLRPQEKADQQRAEDAQRRVDENAEGHAVQDGVRSAEAGVPLPEQVTGTVDAVAHRSLAVRDLLRGETTGLPSGESVAQHIGAPPVTAGEGSWPHGTPLWIYVLDEARHHGGGDRLGEVGGRIVAEVLIGLLRADPASYLNGEPGWRPTLPAAGPAYGLADLLTLGHARPS